jgi:prevent-host-death family protein
MKTFSIMEAQHHLSRVLREVAAGHEVGITRRKKLVARLVPPEDEPEVEWPDFVTRAAEVWGDGWRGASSDDLLDEGRGER